MPPALGAVTSLARGGGAGGGAGAGAGGGAPYGDSSAPSSQRQGMRPQVHRRSGLGLIRMPRAFAAARASKRAGASIAPTCWTCLTSSLVSSGSFSLKNLQARARGVRWPMAPHLTQGPTGPFLALGALGPLAVQPSAAPSSLSTATSSLFRRCSGTGRAFMRSQRASTTRSRVCRGSVAQRSPRMARAANLTRRSWDFLS
mmetsp:Transcript_3992/g.11787  ORF Transcript_3992/g.11787 Transcript_3992/m.11787 type:complete len:201 (+) Transcript_3992:310-912(+)